MILEIIIGLVGIVALATVIITRDSSILWILLLMGIIIGAFLVAERVESTFLLLIFAIPLSVYLAWLARDELVPGRPWFLVLTIISVLGAVFSLLRTNTVLGYSFASVALCAGTALVLSYQRKWTRKRGQWKSKV